MELKSVPDAPSSPVTSGQVTLSGSSAHPIQTFANELLAKIFFYCCEITKWPIAEGDSSNPFALSSVCRRWREVSLSTPFMWSYVNERLEMKDEGNTNFKLARLPTWIMRSKAVPLFIILDIKIDREASLMQSVVNVIDLYKAQLASLTIWIDGDYCRLPTMHLAGLENIQEMAVIVLSGGRTTPQATWHIDMTTSSRIHSLILGGFGMNVSVNEPLSALVSLKFYLKMYTAADCLKLLLYAPQLQSLDLSCDPSREPNEPCPNIHLDNLHDLHIRSIGFSHPIGFLVHGLLDIGGPRFYFLDYLTAPALKHLKLSYNHGEHALLNFLSRSTPPLKTLKIHLWCIDDNDIRPVLQLLPNLATIKLYTHQRSTLFGDDFNFFARALILHPNADTNVCPNLEEIYFIGCHWCELDVESTARMITSRWIGDANIDDGGVRNGKIRAKCIC